MLADLDPVALARLDALVSQRVIRRRPQPDLEESARYLLHATEDIVDADNKRITLRSRLKFACNAAIASVDGMLAAYGFTPPVNRRYYPDVLSVIFDNTPAAALANDLADVVATREAVMAGAPSFISMEILTLTIRLSVNINAAVQVQLGI